MGKWSWIIIAALAAWNIYLFWPGDLYFLNDDFIHIPLTDANELFQTNAVRPIHELLVKLDLLLWGKNAWGYHLTALILHFIVAFQVYDLSKVMQRNWSTAGAATMQRASVLAVALFLLYPQHAESLAWILGRTPTLACIFFLVTLRVFFQTKSTAIHVAIGIACFLLALFTYEQVVLVPVLLLVMAWYDKSDQRRRRIRVSVLLFFAAGVYMLIRRLVTQELVGGYEGGNIVNFRLDVLATNFMKLCARMWTNPGSDPAVFIITAAIGALVIAFLLWKHTKRDAKLTGFLAAGIVLLLAPMVSLGISTRSYESGRYLYIPSVFFVILLGMAISHYARIWKWALVLPAVIALYWFYGKEIASLHYKEASTYSSITMEGVNAHFTQSTDTLRIDRLQTSVRHLPVFRLGFKEGIHWLQPHIDTARIKVLRFEDEARTSGD
jgi:hypothetical protein